MAWWLLTFRALTPSFVMGDVMSFSASLLSRRLVPICLLVVLPGASLAQTFEAPPTFNAAQIKGITRVGANYIVQSLVRSDGLLRHYDVKTPYGDMTVPGDAMVEMRINELKALAAMEKVSSSDTFAKSLAEAGVSPIKYTGRLITNPIGTIESTLSGVGAMFGRIGSGLTNAGKTREDPLASLLGVSSERRTLAAAYGVDPYTDFPPLDAKLKQLSEAAAAGGLAVTGALMVVPGAAGIVVSNLSTAHKLDNIAIEDLARQYDVAQIMDLNRKTLFELGVGPELTTSLLANLRYTPIDMAATVAAIATLKTVQGKSVFFERAAAADTRANAYFMRQQAELLAAEYKRQRGYAHFVTLGGLPFLVAQDGRFVTVAPVDALSWTKETAGRFDAFTASRNQLVPKSTGELRITGQATALARKQLKTLGWTVVEGQRL